MYRGAACYHRASVDIVGDVVANKNVPYVVMTNEFSASQHVALQRWPEAHSTKMLDNVHGGGVPSIGHVNIFFVLTTNSGSR